MSEWGRFNSQFSETMWETRERQRKTRAKRTAEGKCWQCASLIAECKCQNLSHSKAPSKVSPPDNVDNEGDLGGMQP